MQSHLPGPGVAPSPVSRRTAVVIPVRGLEAAKSRLGEVLDAEERQELVELLLRRVIAAADEAGADIVAVVSPDAAALAVARQLGAEAIAQQTSGLNAGLVEARDALTARADRLLVLPADLPSITPADVTALLAAADEGRRAAEGDGRANAALVLLAPDRHGRGTNALLLDPPGVIEPAFGSGSREAHRSRAAAAGAAFLELPGRLDLDLDTPDDLLLVESIGPEALHAH